MFLFLNYFLALPNQGMCTPLFSLCHDFSGQFIPSHPNIPAVVIVSDLCSHCLLGDTVLPIAHIPQWWGDEAVECASVAYPMVVACLQPLEWAQ